MTSKYGIAHVHGPAMEITTMVGCPLMCTFCPQVPLIKAYGRDSSKFLSIENFETVLDKLPKDARIDFSGMSEPWANPDCTDMLELSLNKGFKVAIYTTIYQMTEEDIDRVEALIIKHPTQFDAIVLHLPDAHNNMRGWKYSETWERAFKTLYGINKIFPGKVGAMTMDMNNRVFHPDIRHIPEAREAEKQNARFGAHDRAGVLDVSDVEKTGSQAVELIKRKIRHTRPLTCKSTPFYDRNVLLPNGDVVLCCMDYGLKHIIGNLVKQTYAEMFQNPQFLDLVKTNETPGYDKCSICKACHNIRYIKV